MAIPPPPSRVEVISTQPYRKELVHAGPHDIEAWLDGRFIGSFPERRLALRELDRVAYEAARHDSPEETPERYTPFGVDAGPRADLPVSKQALRAAFVLLCRAYDGTAHVLDRAERALEIPAERITIHDNGDVTIRGDHGEYRVTGTECRCKDFWVRDGAHAGMCKHTIRRELMRLAQELDQDGRLAAVDLSTAYTSIAADDLGRLKAALDRARRLAHEAGAETTIVVANRLLLFHQGSAVVARITGFDGDGVAHIRLTVAHIGDMLAVLKTAMARTPRPAVQVFLDAGEITLLERRVIYHETIVAA